MFANEFLRKFIELMHLKILVAFLLRVKLYIMIMRMKSNTAAVMNHSNFVRQ